MRQLGQRLLWLGHAGDMRDPRAVLAPGINAVVEVADNEPLATLPRDLIRLRFPLGDGGENPAWLIRLAVESTAALIRECVPTIICCSAGLNRSLCLAAAVIAKIENQTFDAVLLELASQGLADVYPGLRHDFRQYFANLG